MIERINLWIHGIIWRGIKKINRLFGCDIVYIYNPWCPLCGISLYGKERKKDYCSVCTECLDSYGK